MKIILYDELRQTRLKYCIGLALKTLSLNKPLEDNFREQRLQPDEEIVIPQDDLYTITWETDFCAQLVTRGHDPIPTSLPNGERPSAAETNSSDANENEADYIITRDETKYADHEASNRNERLNDDVTKRNETTDMTRNEKTDWPNPAGSPKTHEKFSPNTDEGLKNDENFAERDSMNENDAQNSPNRGVILSCPKYQKMMLGIKV